MCFERTLRLGKFETSLNMYLNVYPLVLFFRPQNAIKKQSVIANGAQRNEAICTVLAVVIANGAQRNEAICPILAVVIARHEATC